MELFESKFGRFVMPRGKTGEFDRNSTLGACRPWICLEQNWNNFAGRRCYMWITPAVGDHGLAGSASV